MGWVTGQFWKALEQKCVLKAIHYTSLKYHVSCHIMSHVGLVYGHRVQNISPTYGPTWSHPTPGLLTSPGDS